MDQETIYFLNVNLLSKVKIHFFILLFDMIKHNLILERNVMLVMYVGMLGKCFPGVMASQDISSVVFTL